MRVIVFFDLPTDTASDRRQYTIFRRYLLKNGFMMMQESVYAKLALNQNAAQNLLENLRKNKPPKGLVQVLVITEKQYERMAVITGESRSEIIDTDERLVIL